MRSPIMPLLSMISFMLIAGRSSGRILMKNSFFIRQGNPAAFDPNLISFIDSDSTLHTPYGHVDKDVVERQQEIRPWRISTVNSAINENKVLFRYSPGVRKTNKCQSPGSTEISKGVSNFLPKGAGTPSGARPKVNSMVTEQRLSTSSNSPRFDHMQNIQPKSLTVNDDFFISHHSHGDNHVQRKRNNKRKLGSTPSPGGGH